MHRQPASTHVQMVQRGPTVEQYALRRACGVAIRHVAPDRYRLGWNGSNDASVNLETTLAVFRPCPHRSRDLPNSSVPIARRSMTLPSVRIASLITIRSFAATAEMLW